jgi:hypothetical protein
MGGTAKMYLTHNCQVRPMHFFFPPTDVPVIIDEMWGPGDYSNMQSRRASTFFRYLSDRDSVGSSWPVVSTVNVS